MAGMDLGVGGGSTPLGKIGAGYGTKSYFRPKKKVVRDYEHWQHADIARLRGPNPYSGDDLGFTKNQIEARMGENTEEAAAEYGAAKGALERSVAGNNLRALSGSYARAKERALEGHLARTADIRRRNLILDAMQRRADLQYRLGSTGNALSQGVGLYNSYADQATRRTGQVAEGVGDLVTYAAMACWIAEAIYGIDAEETHTLRAYLNGPFAETWYGRPIMWAYRRWGRQVAARPWAVRLLRPLFSWALSKARGEGQECLTS